MELKQQGAAATLEEHQAALLCLIDEFDRVCRAAQIPYYLFAGTLLGAVRHEGFIPWDDDLDVIMLRADYERFFQTAPSVLDKEHFFLQREFSDHWPMFFSKLRIQATTCIEKYIPKDPLIHRGVYMDIFPCDNAFDSAILRKLQFYASKVVIAKGLDREGYVTDSFKKKLFMRVCRLLPGKLFHRIVKGPKKTGNYVHSFLGGASRYSRSVYPSECFKERKDLPFEGRSFSAPARYDALLRILYDEYMVIPKPEERTCKQHAILVDLTKSYEHYEGYTDHMKFEEFTRSIR